MSEPGSANHRAVPPDQGAPGIGRGGRAHWLGQGRWQAAVLWLTAVVGFITWSPRMADFGGYLQAGRAVLAGADIYRDTQPGINTWPPVFSLVAVPLALVDRVSTYLATSLWLLLSWGATLIAFGLLARIVYGRALTLRRVPAGSDLSITAPELFVPLWLTSTYLFNNYEKVQINVILFAGTLAGLQWLRAGHLGRGALAIGAAAGLKVMPILFLPYLALRGAWRSVVACGLVAAGLSISPILVFGWQRFWWDVGEWQRVVARGWGVGLNNQSVYAMWDRFIGHRMIPFGGGEVYNVPRSGHAGVVVAWALTCTLAGILTLRQFRIAAPDHARVAATEWSVVFIGAAVFGPVAWKHYFVVLLLPNTLLFALWRDRRIDLRSHRIIGAILFGSAVLAILTAHSLVGQHLGEATEVGSAGTLSMLLVLGGMLWLRGRPELLALPLLEPAPVE